MLLQKGDDSDPVLQGIHDEVDELNTQHPAQRCEGSSLPRSLQARDLHRETVEHNLSAGMMLVSIILFLFLGNIRGAIIVALTIPFALLFASICLDLSHIPANLLSLGALDFGMVVDGSVVMIENIVRHFSPGRHPHSGAEDSRCCARSAAARLLRARHHHHLLPAHLHAAGRRGPSLQAHGMDRQLRSDRRTGIRHSSSRQ